MTYQGQVELWDAINTLVAASGGKSNTSVARQKAVADVELAVGLIVGDVARQRDDFAHHIVKRRFNDTRDGACEQCFPGLPGADPSFVCIRHQAMAIVAGRRA